ncbi:TolC family protein [Adhaeribacter aquaticus]|uniref:TolC family protein n=1 Tax=Adhaeribacter aquaticus TaxID=299567 RepID=UPI00047BD163|nr:TolC family protein [Adhaeribacter aquaticus]
MFRAHRIRAILAIILISTFQANGQQQVLSLKEAIQLSLQNYGTINAKASYVQASKEALKQSQSEYLPDFVLSGQQNYGTVNGQIGPLYGYRGLSASASGPPLPTQNWNGTFGSLYLANLNWDFFNFGRARERINVAKAGLIRDEQDLVQEQFQHQVRVAGAYLLLQAAQRLTRSFERNLDRAQALRTVVVARVKNGLNPGVDSSLANAEVSSAKIALVNSQDRELEQSNQLARLLGVPAQKFALDSLFITRIPDAVEVKASQIPENHPILNYYRSRIQLSNQQAKYFKTFQYPTLSFFSVIQGRGSGIGNGFNEQNPTNINSNYWQGVTPGRGNYLVGLGMYWNLTSTLRVRHQVASQSFISQGLQHEYELVNQQIKAQQALAVNKIENALKNFKEAPIQVKAASDAYMQKSVLYRNGLATIVEITQALYLLNRAETDRDIAYSNVWQALLYQSGTMGDFNLFMNEF